MIRDRKLFKEIIHDSSQLIDCEITSKYRDWIFDNYGVSLVTMRVFGGVAKWLCYIETYNDNFFYIENDEIRTSIQYYGETELETVLHVSETLARFKRHNIPLSKLDNVKYLRILHNTVSQYQVEELKQYLSSRLRELKYSRRSLDRELSNKTDKIIQSHFIRARISGVDLRIKLGKLILNYLNNKIELSSDFLNIFNYEYIYYIFDGGGIDIKYQTLINRTYSKVK